MTALILFLILAFAALFLGSKLRARRYRQMERRVRGLRFGKMLTLLGADLKAYVRAVPASEIELQIRRCAQCRSVDLCDACLNGKRFFDRDFCPNYRSIIAHSRLVAERARRRSRLWPPRSLRAYGRD